MALVTIPILCHFGKGEERAGCVAANSSFSNISVKVLV